MITIKEFKYFIFKNYYRKISKKKANRYYPIKHKNKKNLLLIATKLIKKILDPTNNKQYHQTFLKNRN